MESKYIIITGLLIFFMTVASINALYVPDNSQIQFGHVIAIKDIVDPQLSPGEQGILKITIKNNAIYDVSDIEINLLLSSEFQFYQDVSGIKISLLKSGEEKEITYRIIAVPGSKEGIYKANMTVDYISHYGANAINYGQKQEDAFNLGLTIKSDPSMFVILDQSEITNKVSVGGVTLKLVNNGTSDIKFLTVNLKDSKEYQVLTDSNYYVGDLDSNDYQSVTYKIKLNGAYNSINLPLSINYKDSLNQEYTRDINVALNVRDASEVSSTNNNNYYFVLAGIILLIVIIVVVIVRSRRKRNSK